VEGKTTDHGDRNIILRKLGTGSSPTADGQTNVADGALDEPAAPAIVARKFQTIARKEGVLALFLVAVFRRQGLGFVFAQDTDNIVVPSTSY
jgi:hypothetical protein